MGADSQFDSLRSGILMMKLEVIYSRIGHHLYQKYNKQSLDKIERYLGQKLYGNFRPGTIISNSACRSDYLIDVLDLDIDSKNWGIYKSLLSISNYIFLKEKTCLICERPIQISFDSQGYLHNEAQPAIQFIDDYRLYSFHGITLPQKIGELPLQAWQPQWILKESKARVREALVKGIGYKKISSQLLTTEIDCWHNFLLIEIKNSESKCIVYLLEINVNTAKIERAREVPSNVRTIRNAECYVDNDENWHMYQAESQETEIPF